MYHKYKNLKVHHIIIVTENVFLQRKSDGQSIDRKDLMVMLANLKGLYIRASYSNERGGRAL